MKNNKEVSSAHNDQVHPHQEGQQQNTSSGNNNSRETQEMNGGREGRSNTETESDRANRNEDEGIRGGNSSI